MSTPVFDLQQTIERQHRASNPRGSAWVRANAGSGKTHVLAQRVIRLLLQGVEPSKILCLTFTKAAAANMSLRIYDTLAKWTSMDDGALADAIEKTGASVPDDLNISRRLFVRTVETPGGLKVQTIHAFCERLLHLFPFEANVSARFEAIEEETQQALMREARLAVMNGSARNGGGEIRQALTLVSEKMHSDAFEDLLKKVVAKRKALVVAAKLQPNGLKRELGKSLGLTGGDSLRVICNEALNGGLVADRLDYVLAALTAGNKSDAKFAADLGAALAIPDLSLRARAYIDCYFTNTGSFTPKKTLGTNKVPQDICALLQDEQSRMITLRNKMRAVAVLEQSLAIYRLGEAVQAEYSASKALRGYLDFDDLIERTGALLRRFDANWVLYKLDAGIDHILLDEAQDTSPAQWEILIKLTEEFFSGASARAVSRTFFAVGDEKQSIFSFQGAAPHEFGRNLAFYKRHIESAKQTLEDVELHVSFRSSQTILDAVDTVFRPPEHRAGLTVNDDVAPVHEARHAWLPGYVELFPLIAPAGAASPQSWLLPVDRLDEQAPAAIMAQQVASKIAWLIDANNMQAVHEKDGRVRLATAGDIMILVRKRSAFFNAVIRTLKQRGVPVAGADRLDIVDHIAVMDLIAAGRAALLPQDDLIVATVLKSPLIGLTDDDLLTLAPRRSGTLLAALQTSSEKRHREAADRIGSWQDMARRQTPYEFYARLLGAERGRHALLSRLGHEANDAIDEFLSLALDTSGPGVSTLPQFLDRLIKRGLEIKRDMEGAGSAVRVMTVHAAKGLEAKIVFLPDTVSTRGGHPADIVDLQADGEADLFIWRDSKNNDPEAVTALLQKAGEAADQEERRLLYVAMTRAEERLYIGGFHGARKPADTCWYNMMARTLADADGVARTDDGRIQIGAESKLDEPPAFALSPSAPSPPRWLWQPAPPERSPQPPLRPSTALASADQDGVFRQQDGPDIASGGNDGSALSSAIIGQHVHELLYRLPLLEAADRLAAAERYLKARASGLSKTFRGALARRVLTVIDHPDLKEIFASDARAEIAIAGKITGADGRDIDITGRIDRLCVTGRDVILADFKTGAARPAGRTPAAYVRQMALYRAVLEPLFPGKPVRAVLIWTGSPEPVELSAAILDAALADVTGVTSS